VPRRIHVEIEGRGISRALSCEGLRRAVDDQIEGVGWFERVLDAVRFANVQRDACVLNRLVIPFQAAPGFQSGVHCGGRRKKKTRRMLFVPRPPTFMPPAGQSARPLPTDQSTCCR